MPEDNRNGAVIYLRVSTKEQADDPFNLSKQEKICKDFCAGKGLAVTKIFTDPGQSGRTAERPEFQRMVQFCKQRRREIGFVIVQNLSRFARNSRDQAHFIAELRAHQIALCSVYEPNVNDTAPGKFAANMIGASNQYFSDALSESTRDRMRAAVAAGRFPWRAPIGYRNIGGKNGANIESDPERAPLIRMAFDLLATGLHKKTEVLSTITERGLRTQNRQALSTQTFQAALRNPLYCGWVTLPSDKKFEPVRGLHEPIVSQEVFNRVQALFSGKKPTAVPKRKFNPALPLKCLVRCAACGTPLTGGFAKGRTKKYARYWCRKRECRAVKLSSAQLESQFLSLLRRLRAHPEAKTLFPKVAAKVWAAKQASSEHETDRLRRRLEDQKLLKSELLKAKLRGEVAQPDYEQANAEFIAEITRIENKLQSLTSDIATVDAFVRFAELHLMDIARAWEMAGPEQRQRVQTLLFQDGLAYSPETGILNRSNCSLFSMLETISDEKGLLASPTGFEPVLPP